MSDEEKPPSGKVTPITRYTLPPIVETPGNLTGSIPPGVTRNRKGKLVPEDYVYGDQANVTGKDGRSNNNRGKTKAFKEEQQRLIDRALSDDPKNKSEHPEMPFDNQSIDRLTTSSSQSDTSSQKATKGLLTLPDGRSYASLNRSIQQLNRQEKVFELSVLRGLSNVAIADELGISPVTVATDLKSEISLRQAELVETRDDEKLKQLMLIQELINLGRESRNNPGTGAFAAYTKALEMRARILGLDAPTKMEIGVTHLLEAIDVLPPSAQAVAWEKVVSASQDTPLAQVTLPPTAWDAKRREPSQAILEAVVVGPVVSENLTSTDAIIVDESRSIPTTYYNVGGRQDSPPMSAADRREAAIREAMGMPDPVKARPKAEDDPILRQSQEVHASAVSAAQDRLTEREASLSTAHVPGTPAMTQDAATGRKRSPDPAAYLMEQDYFYKLSPQTQVELIQAARDAATERDKALKP